MAPIRFSPRATQYHKWALITGKKVYLVSNVILITLSFHVHNPFRTWSYLHPQASCPTVFLQSSTPRTGALANRQALRHYRCRAPNGCPKHSFPRPHLRTCSAATNVCQQGLSLPAKTSMGRASSCLGACTLCSFHHIFGDSCPCGDVNAVGSERMPTPFPSLRRSEPLGLVVAQNILSWGACERWEVCDEFCSPKGRP